MPEVILNAPASPYPLRSTKPDEQPDRFLKLKLKYPQLTDSELSGERGHIIGKVAKKLNVSPIHIEGVINGTIV